MVRKRTTYEGVQKVDITVEGDDLRVMIIMFSGEESGKREERIITEEVANQVVVNNCRVKFIGGKATIDSPEGAIKISIDHELTENIKNIEVSQ